MDPGPGLLLAMSGAADAPYDQQLVLPSEKDTLWDMLVFLHGRGSAPLIQGLKEKVNSLINLFKGSLSCLPSRYGSTPGT